MIEERKKTWTDLQTIRVAREEGAIAGVNDDGQCFSYYWASISFSAADIRRCLYLGEGASTSNSDEEKREQRHCRDRHLCVARSAWRGVHVGMRACVRACSVYAPSLVPVACVVARVALCLAPPALAVASPDCQLDHLPRRHACVRACVRACISACVH